MLGAAHIEADRRALRAARQQRWMQRAARDEMVLSSVLNAHQRLKLVAVTGLDESLSEDREALGLALAKLIDMIDWTGA